MFFTAPAVLFKFTSLCIVILISILLENRYFALAFYRYYRENLDSVIFETLVAALHSGPKRFQKLYNLCWPDDIIAFSSSACFDGTDTHLCRETGYVANTRFFDLVWIQI